MASGDAGPSNSTPGTSKRTTRSMRKKKNSISGMELVRVAASPPSNDNGGIRNDTELLSLPDEMLLEIMGYLDHGDRLVIRQVCGRLNRVLTNSRKFLTSSKFVIPSNWEPVFSMFLKSSVLWKHLDIRSECKSVLGSPIWNSRKKEYLKLRVKSVEGIEIKDITVRWIKLQSFLGKLSGLKELGIRNSVLRFEDRDGWFVPHDKVKKFQEIQRRLEKLSIVVNDVRDANFILKKFTGPACSLQELQLEIIPSPTESPHDYKKFSFLLSEFIRVCKSTLRRLVIAIPVKHCKRVPKALGRLAASPGSEELMLDVFHWSLTPSFSFGEDVPMQSSDTRVMLEFIKRQSGLKSLSLPAKARLRQFAPDLLDSLTSNIVEFGSKGNVVTPSLLQKLPHLNSLHLKFVLETDLETAVANNIFPEMKCFDICGFTGVSVGSVLTIGPAFPNLSTLCIRPCSREPANSYQGNIDQDLQFIIQNLSGLKNLVLGYCDGLTDFGIAGIDEVESQKLRDTKSIYLKRSLLEYGISRNGEQLSSLKSLKTVYLHGKTTKITDVGIHFGLNFPDLRILHFVGGPQMSDWGLVELGIVNPSLQLISVYSDSNEISESGSKMLQSTLPRLAARNMMIKAGPAPEEGPSPVLL